MVAWVGPFTLLAQRLLNAVSKVDALHYPIWPQWPPIIQLCVYFRLPIIWSASRVSLYKERAPLPHQSKNRFDLCYPLQIGKLTVKLCWYFRETERPNCQTMRGKNIGLYIMWDQNRKFPPLDDRKKGGGQKRGGCPVMAPIPPQKKLKFHQIIHTDRRKKVKLHMKLGYERCNLREISWENMMEHIYCGHMALKLGWKIMSHYDWNLDYEWLITKMICLRITDTNTWSYETMHKTNNTIFT